MKVEGVKHIVKVVRAIFRSGEGTENTSRSTEAISAKGGANED